MIISFSGRIGSGKDLAGNICKILLQSPHLNNEGVETFLNKNIYESDGNWEIRKWADKLKDIICLLIGCSRDQLENESFKSKELGEEWWYWYMALDGGYSPIILDYLTTTKKQLKNYEGLELIKPTPRFLMQYVGTNLFRNQLHPEIWVNSLMSEYKNKSTLISEVNYLGDSRCGICKKPTKDVSYFLCDEHIEKSKNNYPNWIITDLRFLNEMEAVKKKGGITIRVNRNLEESKDQHESETELDNSEFDYVVDNNSDIQSLIEKVKEILIKEKLI